MTKNKAKYCKKTKYYYGRFRIRCQVIFIKIYLNKIILALFYIIMNSNKIYNILYYNMCNTYTSEYFCGNSVFMFLRIIWIGAKEQQKYLYDDYELLLQLFNIISLYFNE